MARLNRVTFFSKRDLAGRPMLEQAKELLEIPHDFQVMELNDLLEFHHIHQYFENGMFPDGSSDKEKGRYLQIVKEALSMIRIKMLEIVPDRLIQVLNDLEYVNRENFWMVFQYFEVYKKVDKDLFRDALTTNTLNIRYVLTLKQLVHHFNTEIRTFLFTYDSSAELILSHYEEKLDEPSNYIFPKSLSDADKYAIISEYLDAPEPNLNYVDLVIKSKHLKIPPKIVLKAKQAAARIKEEILTDENSFKVSVGATMDMDQAEPVIYENIEGDTRVCYGGLFFDSLDTDIKIFSLFSDVFLYTTDDGLIDLVNRTTEMDTLEKIFMRSKSEYHTGIIFAKKDMLSLSQLGIFNYYLTKRGRSAEEIINNAVHYLFNDYYKVDGMLFSMPDHKLNPADKIRLLASQLDYLLKQFKLFATDGRIDHELLQIDSTPVQFSDIPSLIAKKYVFSKNESIRTIQYHFFDENRMLADRKDVNDRRTLFQTLKTGKANKNEFEEYQISFLNQAVEAGDLMIRADGTIEMTDPFKVIIAGKLLKNNYMSYWHFHPAFRAHIDRLIDAGVLDSTSQLFTSDEISYLNFFLNKKEFSNSKDLRNRYIHGSNDRDIKKQEFDYLYFLRTVVLILLKLKDDLQLKKNSGS